MKIAILIPSTSRNRSEWKTLEDSYLFNFFLTFRDTCEPAYEYTFFVGVDKDDAFYAQYYDVLEAIPDVRIVPVQVERGYVTHIWNILAKLAFHEGYDYMFQCGDDVKFDTPGWVKACVDVLSVHGNKGVTGPYDRNNTRLLTQTFVHRTHYEVFNFYFPPEIPNWFCDDWINEVYEKPLSLPVEYTCVNSGGDARYPIFYCKDLCKQLVQRDKKVLNNFLVSHEYRR